MPKPDMTDEDFAQDTKESSLRATVLVMISVLVMLYCLVAGFAFCDLVAEVGIPRLRLLGVDSDITMFCMVAAPPIFWLFIGAVLVRRLPWWAHFSEMPYHRERNLLGVCTSVAFALSASLALGSVLWS